jgi:hypothetical protein
MLEIMRWHAPADGFARVRRASGRMLRRLVGLLKRMQVPDPGDRAGALSPSVLGRTAPAPADRGGAGLRTRPRDRRRTHDGARRHDAAPDPAAAARACGRVRDLAAVRHPRFRRGRRLCDDLCVIYAGQTVEAGAVQAILDTPSHPYTRALLACHPDRATDVPRHSRLGPLAAGASHRLPVRATLHGRAGTLPGRKAASRTRSFRRRSPLRAVRMTGDPLLTIRDVSVRLGGPQGIPAAHGATRAGREAGEPGAAKRRNPVAGR